MNKPNLQDKGYYIGLLTIISILLIIDYLTKTHSIFQEFYKINYEQINTNIISIFGTMFGFLFASMAILFSLNDQSFFVQLLKEHDRNKKDIVGYFSMAIITSLITILLGLFLTISYIGENSLGITLIAVDLVFFLGIIAITQFFFLIIMFILLIQDSPKQPASQPL